MVMNSRGISRGNARIHQNKSRGSAYGVDPRFIQRMENNAPRLLPLLSAPQHPVPLVHLQHSIE